MDNFMHTEAGFETACELIETINRSSDDYLFVWDIQSDIRWFFGDIDQHYNIRTNGSETNNTQEMMRIIYPADRAAVLESLKEIAQGEKDCHNMDYRWINRDGQKVWINCHGTVIRDRYNKPALMIGRVTEEKLRHLFNPLTCLWNKNKLQQDLKRWMEHGRGYLLLLDIDSLSGINLSRGREYGDQLLKEVAEYCEGLETVHTAYHVDQDHFMLTLKTSSQKRVQAIYNQIKKAMMEKCTFTASAVPVDKGLFFDEMQLLDSINMTLKKAKSISDNHIVFFSAEDLKQKIRALALLEDLKQSVENDFEGFEVYYQPQVRCGDYSFYGVEALLRYNSKTYGRVFPDEFIPVLEQSRLIQPVGLWVLRQAAAQCRQWQEFLPDLRVSVNFSALQFGDPFLAEQVIRTIQDEGLAGPYLTVEITESMELHNSSQLVKTMRELRSYGIRFAIDDFGTGYSNLSYLKQLNVDEIKIDRVFISGLEKGTYNYKLISNVIEFAKENDIRICCEGVENAGELAILELMAPDVIQGYLFNKPNTAANIARAYIHTDTEEFRSRMELLRRIQAYKAHIGLLHFDPMDILQENGVGLWVLRVNETYTRYELHIEEVMQKVIAADVNFTPMECFDYWFNKIHPDHLTYVQKSFDKMVHGQKAVQVEFPWLHPEIGEVMIRFSGKRVASNDGMIRLEGYCKIITDITDARREVET